MKSLIKSIIAVLIVVGIVLGILGFKENTNYKIKVDPVCVNARTNALGNRLANYFYLTNTKKGSNKKFAYESVCNAQSSNMALRDFYNKLIWQRNEKINYVSDLAESAWNSRNDDGSEKKNYLKFWQTIRPKIRAIYEQSIPKIMVANPVVHFRCSDIPFIKHWHYHLIKEESAKWMALKIKERGFKKIIMLACNSHFSQSKNGCSKYVEFYSEVFKKTGLEVEFQCNSIMQDFAMMVYSPLLVSLNSSSFSFMAGVSKDPKNYLSCNMGLEKDNQYLLQTQADWIIDHKAPLLHSEVKDYKDVSAVIKKLQEVKK